MCVNKMDSFTCNCNPPYFGANCEDQNFCYNRNCNERGTCTNDFDSYICVCNAGYTGADCEVDIDECLLMETVCSGHGNCSHGIATFTCSCDPGYTGQRCETNIDECVNRNCSGNGVCVDGVNSFSCECMSGFAGEMCSVVTQDVRSDDATATIAGGVVGGLVGVVMIAVIVIVIVLIIKNKKESSKYNVEEELPTMIYHVRTTWCTVCEMNTTQPQTNTLPTGLPILSTRARVWLPIVFPPTSIRKCGGEGQETHDKCKC
ncbi:fibropellin-3-like isoform X4 [Halichondria panicea]|uniref:fibropellin-3-like isoform X4 n=1 Tax=Halichondria panicea TaxID=6063 RepID=UPI00312B3D86